ncbi:MAG TPA: HRDC domain-containing protein [Egibacteraceae bacterium]|nr:HRDC domain-containing protein [Egibacteraceae bacterium]
MPLEHLTVVDRTEDLVLALESLGDVERVGVDVERADWDRYYRAAALIQVGGAGQVVVVDPLTAQDLRALDAFLQPRLTVFHAVENDLEPLVNLGVKPPHICDTAVAAAVLGLPTGLEALLRDRLGVTLSGDKSAMQRANWEARPLTKDMLAYAAGDVADLPELWAVLDAELEQAGRRQWYEQELAALLAMPPVEDRRRWSRTKGAGRLDVTARARLRRLWETREQLGRDTDTAPGRIATDAILVDLAKTPPASVSELSQRGLRRQSIREFGPTLLAAVADGTPLDAEERRPLRAPTDADRALIDELRQIRAERAEALGIDAGVLCPSRTLAPAVLSSPETPDELREALGLRPWQWEQLGAAFCEAADLDGPGTPAPPSDPSPAEHKEQSNDG